MELWILLGVLALVVMIFIYYYNSLARSKVRVNEAWSDIDVQLKRRTDLIPNLIETVKGYAKHEKEVLENVTKARTQLQKAGTVKEKQDAENQLSSTLKSLFAVAENYPDLKANQNFLELQRELSDTENKIQAARRFYNSNVKNYNTKIEVIPTNVISAVLGYKKEDYFEIEEEDKRNVKVNF